MAQAQVQPTVVVGRSVTNPPKKPTMDPTATTHAPMVPAMGGPMSLSSITSIQKRPS